MSKDNYKQINEDISLYGLISLFFQHWLVLVICGFSFAFTAMVWAIFQPNVYTAEITIMPVKKDEKSMAGVASQLGGLASLAGLNLNKDLDENAKLALKMLTSKKFIMEFIEEEQLAVPIMAAKSWDIETDKLEIDPDVYDVETKTWVREAVAPRKSEPSLQEIFEVFVELLEVEEEPKSKFIKVSLDFYSPKLATAWLNKLIDKLNRDIRAIDKQLADESINYLTEAYESTALTNMKKAISILVEEQIQAKMLTEIRKDYVFMVVDPAIVPEIKSKPKRAIIVVVGGFIGGIIGLIIILFISGRKNHLNAQRG